MILIRNLILSLLLIAHFSCVSQDIKSAKDIVIINIRDASSTELKPFLEEIYSSKALVVGLCFYYDTTILKGALEKFISIENHMPYDMSNGYLLKDESLQKNFQDDVSWCISTYQIDGKRTNSFALEVAKTVEHSIFSSQKFRINYLGNYEKFSLADVEYVTENMDLLENKIVLIGYIGNTSADPALLDEIDFDVYPTPKGLMYETVIQANIIANLLNLKE